MKPTALVVILCALIATDHVSAQAEPGPLGTSGDAALVAQGPQESVLEYSVAVASLTTLAEARTLQQRWTRTDIPFYIAPVTVRGNVYYRLLAGMLPGRAGAEALSRRLFNEGIKEAMNAWDIRPTRFAFRLGSYGTAQEADAAVSEFSLRNVPAYKVPAATAYHVYAGGYQNVEEARLLQGQLARAGISAELVERVGFASSMWATARPAAPRPALPQPAVEAQPAPVEQPVADRPMPQPVEERPVVEQPAPREVEERPPRPVVEEQPAPRPAVAVREPADSPESDGVGLRLGAGTDISLGIAYGAELNYTKLLGGNALEIGLAGFGGSFDETTEEGCCTYNEETNILVLAAVVNYLISYALERSGPYFVAGFGVGGISVEWEERSPDDTSLGTPLPGGGSMQSEDATSGGTILNFGIGQRFSRNFDIRAQVPTFFVFSAPGEASAVVPTFTLTLGLRF